MNELDPITAAAALYEPEKQWEMIFRALAQPFDADAVKEYQGANGQTLRKLRPRAVMNRLDDVVGPLNWSTEYVPVGTSGAVCRLKLMMPDGSTVVKAGAGAAPYEMASPGDAFKAAYSDALVLAAVAYGIGREYYQEGTARLAGGQRPEPRQERREDRGEYREDRRDDRRDDSRDNRRGQAENRGYDRRDDRRSGGDDYRNAPRSGGGGGSQNGTRRGGGPPRSGKALFAWCKDREQEYEVNLVKYINGWAKLQDFPGRMVDWDTEQVALAFAEASRKLDSLSHAEAG